MGLSFSKDINVSMIFSMASCGSGSKEGDLGEPNLSDKEFSIFAEVPVEKSVFGSVEAG